MGQHRVRFVDPASQAVVERRVEAASAALAERLIADGGGLVLESSPVRAIGPTTWRDPAGRRRTSAEVSLLCREIRALIGAGLSVVEALEALAAARADPTGASLHAELLEPLRQGKSLSGAMRAVGGFPPLLIASVQSGERTSGLGEALDAFLRYDDTVGLLKRRVISAALYPATVVALGLAVAVFLLMVVIPRFAALYGEMGQAAGTATTALLALSSLLKAHWWLVPAALALVALGVALLAGAGRWRRLLQRLTDAVPWLAGQLDHFEKARVFEALSLLVRGGYSLHEAIALCMDLATDGRPDRRLQIAGTEIERGAGVAHAFAAAGLTDAVTERLLRAGDRGGDFDRVLQAIASRHARAFETFVERSTRLVEPVLLLAVALLVGGMVVLLYMPIFDIAASVR